jgi:hypothetical protein
MSQPISRPISPLRRPRFLAAVCGLAAALLSSGTILAQRGPVSPVGNVPTNDLPNPYQTYENYFKLPNGRKFGSTSAVEIDKDGKTIWVAERCGGNSLCLQNPTIGKCRRSIRFFTRGVRKLIKVSAHNARRPYGIFVDRDGNVW